jgi:hypothetical protein
MKRRHQGLGCISALLLLTAASGAWAEQAEEATTVEGLVYQYYVEDDSEEVAIGIEGSEVDYLVLPGGAEQQLRRITGATVRALGRLERLENGDVTILVERYELLEQPPEHGE